MSINKEGIAYMWGIGTDSLYEVDLETGAGTLVGALGYNLNFAQDGAFDDEGNLWLTAFDYTSYSGLLLLCDTETGACENYGSLLGAGAECCASGIPVTCVPPEHDVSLKEIVKPQDGYAVDPMDIQLRLENKGNHSEITDVQFEIIKCENGPLLLEETFDTWPPSGWSYGGFTHSYTNNAVGTSPETAYLYTSYYSNGYLQSPQVNASGYEKIAVNFRGFIDIYDPYYTPLFYVQYRKNASSVWRDASPWDNPLTEDLGPLPFEIGCYGWGEDLGAEFQMRFYWGSYYYYLQYGSGLYLDDIQIIGCAGCAEYAEIVEDVEVPWQEEVLVDFPGWTPSEWHNPDFQDTWEEYPLQAYTLLEDNNIKNNKKQKLLQLYYPFLHDVGATGIEGPETGPGQTFPMGTTIMNLGQYDECCFKTHMEVVQTSTGEDQFIEEYFDSGIFPPEGWTRTNTKWASYNSNYAGGDPPEARFYYSPSETGMFRLYTPPIDTTGHSKIKIEFKHYVNHYTTPYTLRVETSPDGYTWDSIWSDEPTATYGPEDVELVTYENVGGDNFHVSWTFDGYSWNINYWFVDNIIIRGIPSFEPEYEDEMCCESIIPGEEVLFEMNDWTPAFLAEEETGTVEYLVKAWTDMQDPEDNNQANDEWAKEIVLDYFHDVEIQDVTSPTLDRSDRKFYACQAGYPGTLVWFDPEDPHTYNTICTFPDNDFPQGATFIKEVEWVCDTNGDIYKRDPDSPDSEYVGNSQTGGLVSLAYNGKDKTLYGMSTSSFYEIDQATGKGTLIGSLGVSSLMISCAANSDGIMYAYDLGFGTANTYTIDLDTGHATIVGPTGVSLNFGQDMAYDFEEDIMYAAAFNYNTFYAELHEIDMDTGAFTYIDMLDAGAQTTCFAIPGGGFGIDVYVQSGNQNIQAVAGNVGTFPETGMTAYETILEYISDCENGTIVYEDTIENIDIEEPLTGTYPLTFSDYTFAEEGPYEIIFEIVDDNDDSLGNNDLSWGVGVDDTAPVSYAPLFSPEDPDGEAGWYISDLTITLSAYDPQIGCDTEGVGVKEIRYTVDGDSGVIAGAIGTFDITEDGDDILVEYWAIDWLGNTESKHSFTVDMDQTIPEIDEDGVHWEAFQPEPLGDWFVRFWTNATDATSGMDRVVMYINEGVHEVNESPDGARYDFVIMWSTAFETCTFKWEHYDVAGWHKDDEIPGNEPYTNTYSANNQVLNLKQQIRSL
jgi:hypothetical protein